MPYLANKVLLVDGSKEDTKNEKTKGRPLTAAPYCNSQLTQR
jgi:hypothetical protein